MPNLAEIIREHHAEILKNWTQQAQRVAATRGLSGPEVQNIIPVYLLALADAGEGLGRFEGKRRQHVESYLSSRLRQGFQLAEIIEEFALLSRCIAAVWNSGESTEAPHHREIAKLFEEFHLATMAVTSMFTHHMIEDEQIEKRYIRLLQTVALEALQKDAPEFRKLLTDALRLVREAMGAKAAALFLANSAADRLELVASVGGTHEESEAFLLDTSSFVGQVAAHEETTTELNAVTTNLKISDTLRRSGIHSLLGARLWSARGLVGVIYVGLAETRPFTARESRRLESLTAQMTLHLENAKLFTELREHVDLLQDERHLRERFVSVLAHDLRGPLAAAKVSAQVLMRHPERLDQRRELAIRIDRNIDRMDRMIRDLLDANRIRAGERLPLRIDECDLVTVAREVYEELVATFGDRFVLKTKQRLLGFWCADELRRAVWNLATNAVKYGSEETPITIRVSRTPQGALISVHNWGAPISPEDQTHLFRPFSRTQQAQMGGQEGWGLGLTLVHGCAIAHGGCVRVESSQEAGTIFTLELPADARLFQYLSGEPSTRADLPSAPRLH